MITRRRFLTEFKAKFALEAIKGHWMVADLAAKYELRPTQIAALNGPRSIAGSSAQSRS